MKKSSPSRAYCFLIDANISRAIIPLLTENISASFVHVSECSDTPLTDEEIVAIAKRNQWVIITHDLDYGEIYYLRERGALGVVMLRLTDQRSHQVITRLTEFFASGEVQNHDLRRSLVIVSDGQIRILS